VCGPDGCGPPLRIAIGFDSEDELARAGFRRVVGARDRPARFDGGVWIAPAGTFDEWLDGPRGWWRVADRAHGWTITARVGVREGKPACRENSRGPGIKLQGDLGQLSMTLLPREMIVAGGSHPLPPATAGGMRTVRIEGRGEQATLSVDGATTTTAALNPTHSAPPTLVFGQLGCTRFESHWDALTVEARTRACDACDGEHPLLAMVRTRIEAPRPATSPAPGQGTAYSRCLAYAALDHGVREIIPGELADAGQPRRAQQVARLQPLVDGRSVTAAAHLLRPLGEVPERPGCDPVHDASECDYDSPEVQPLPQLVTALKRMVPNRPWVDHTASGAEAIMRTAVAMHARAGQPALTLLLERLRVLAGRGGSCRADP